MGFILIGISVLNIAGLQEQISRLLRLLPEIVVAMLILFLGLVIANFLSRAVLLASVNRGYGSPMMLSWSVRFMIWILAISMALDELERGAANGDRGVFDRVRRIHVGAGDCVWPWRAGFGAQVPGTVVWARRRKTKTTNFSRCDSV